MKYLKHTLETYVYSYYNMCNIPIYFCNIDIQYLQHTSEILKTYSCNIRISPFFFRTTQHSAGKRPILEIYIMATVIVAPAGGVAPTRSRTHLLETIAKEAADRVPERERERERERKADWSTTALKYGGEEG
jgi:hypothetical protein